MRPGNACLSCHGVGSEQAFVLAGTVYPTAHEPDNCNGTSGGSGVSVVITDANNKTMTLQVNSVGNFYSQGRTLATPYRAKVVSAAGERAMGASQSTGDCNSCHTQDGANGAPGRIMAP